MKILFLLFLFLYCISAKPDCDKCDKQAVAKYLADVANSMNSRDLERLYSLVQNAHYSSGGHGGTTYSGDSLKQKLAESINKGVTLDKYDEVYIECLSKDSFVAYGNCVFSNPTVGMHYAKFFMSFSGNVEKRGHSK